MLNVIMSSEKVKREFVSLARGILQEQDIYIKDGGSLHPWLVLKKYPVNGIETDYRLSITRTIVEWSAVKSAIEAFHTTFTITKWGAPIAVLMASEHRHPVLDFTPRHVLAVLRLDHNNHQTRSSHHA